MATAEFSFCTPSAPPLTYSFQLVRQMVIGGGFLVSLNQLVKPMYYIGLDVHKRKITRKISCCVKDSRGQLYAEGSLPATSLDLDRWMKTLPQPWSAAMEATMFTGWIYDRLKPHAAAQRAAHPK
jgi:hypothetical protein